MAHSKNGGDRKRPIKPHKVREKYIEGDAEPSLLHSVLAVFSAAGDTTTADFCVFAPFSSRAEKIFWEVSSGSKEKSKAKPRLTNDAFFPPCVSAPPAPLPFFPVREGMSFVNEFGASNTCIDPRLRENGGSTR